MADMFRKAGFDVVILQQDVGNLDFKRAVRRFEEAALDADIAVVFYAGHGIEVSGINYMIPTDAKLASDFDAPDEAIPLDRIIDAVASARQLRLIILDACRDNPFVTNMKRRFATRSVSAGLAKVEPTTADTLIAYAARAGSTAADGTSEHSPYTTALLHNLMIPGVDIRLAFGRVRDEVMSITGQSQEPYVYGSLGGRAVSLLGTSDSVAALSSAPIDPNAEARLDYQQFEKVGTKEAWDAFLILHPSGPYADLARAQRAKLAASGTPNLPAGQPDPKTSQIIAALTAKPGSDAAASGLPTGSNDKDLARMLQAELKRVGCYQDTVDGEWSGSSRRALDAFNQNAGTKLDTKKASLEAVGAVRDTQPRICPLTCGPGFRADGDSCVSITCDPGYAMGPSGICEPAKDRPRSVERSPAMQKPKDQAPEPKRQVNTRPPAEEAPAARVAPPAAVRAPPPPPVARAAPPASAPAQVACDRFGCQPVKKGCKMRTEDFRGETQQEAVCN
jgi:Caspase domain